MSEHYATPISFFEVNDLLSVCFLHGDVLGLWSVAAVVADLSMSLRQEQISGFSHGHFHAGVEDQIVSKRSREMFDDLDGSVK